MDDGDREFEHSELSGTFSRDGERVDVEIYRYAGTQDPRQLVVIGLSSGRCTAWQKTFATDQEAHDAFTAMVDADGMAPFLGRRPEVLNQPTVPAHEKAGVGEPGGLPRSEIGGGKKPRSAQISPRG